MNFQFQSKNKNKKEIQDFNKNQSTLSIPFIDYVLLSFFYLKFNFFIRADTK